MFANLIKGQDLYHLWAACGQGAGFIKHQGVKLAGLLQCISIGVPAHRIQPPGRTPAMIDIGVASPRAYGQAMINTVVAITNVYPTVAVGRRSTRGWR